MKSAKVLALNARHARIRKTIKGSDARPRLSVYRSLKAIHAQLIDDDACKTLLSESSLKIKKGTKTEKAKLLGLALAAKAKEKGIKEVVFDRSGYKYHGRVKALAEGAREGGLKF